MSKNMSKAITNIDKNKFYNIDEALELIKKISFEKFDPSIEVSFNLNLDVRQSNQQLRGSIILPNGTGKVSKVLVVGNKDDQNIAKKSKADYVGDIDIMEKVKNENWFDFDFIVTTPEYMPKIAKYGKILGPKGLMPNPKLGTVTKDIKVAIENIKKGQVEYRTNDNGLINLSIGKKSFSTKKLIENYNTIYELIKSKRPFVVKGDFILGISISSTMGPGIKIKRS